MAEAQADHPAPAAFRLSAAVFVQRDSKILLLQRGAGELTGAWYMPGGAVDAGETPEDAARRELFEESGLVPDGPLTLIGARANARLWPRIGAVCLRLRLPGG